MSYSNTVSVRTVPATPTANPATQIAPTSFVANWTLVTGASYYLIDVASDPDFTMKLYYWMGTSVSGPSQLINNGPQSGQKYYYRVRAINSSGSSAYSNVVPVEKIPKRPTALPATNLSSNSFVANWLTVSDATSYRLLVSASKDFANSSIKSGYSDLNVTASFAEVKGLNLKTTYYSDKTVKKQYFFNDANEVLNWQYDKSTNRPNAKIASVLSYYTLLHL